MHPTPPPTNSHPIENLNLQPSSPLRYSHCSPVCFIAAGIYMERLAEQHPALAPTSLNLHRLLFTGVVIAIKFFDDKYYSNGFYAKVGGVSRSELNLLELEMLQLMSFNAYVGVEDIQR